MSALKEFLHARALRNNPEYATQFYNRQAAEQYQQIMKEQMPAAEKHAEAEFYMDQIDRANQGPLPGGAREYEGMSPMERWRAEANAMMATGNPVLQQQAMNILARNQQAQLSSSSAPTSVQEWQFARSRGYPGSYTDFKKEFKGGVTVNTGSDFIKPEHAKSMVDAQGKRVDVPVGTTYAQAQDMGWTYQTPYTDAEAKTTAQAEISRQMLGQLEELVFDEENPVIVEGFSGWVDEARSTGKPLSIALDYALDKIGVPLTKPQAEVISLTRSLSNQLLAAMRGAQVGPAEQERFEAQLPIPGQPINLFRTNMMLTKQNLDYLTKLQRGYKRGGSRPSEDTTQLPPGFQWED